MWVFRLQGQQVPHLVLLWAVLSDITAGSCRWGSKQERALGQVPARLAATLLHGPHDPGHRGWRCPWWGKARVKLEPASRTLQGSISPPPEKSAPCECQLLVLGSRQNADRGPRGPGHTVHHELCASPPGRGVTVTEGSGWASAAGLRVQASCGRCHLMLGLTSCSTRR